ncbi:MAG: hypothetical protein IPF48_11170 [Sphingomonadales bacterium]|nr:hypothetical protein [Sphingomonadales bacterium]
MNQLESKVRPYLTPMVTGENVTLDQAALATVAQWLTLKVMVVEHDAQNTVLTPQADRSRFRDTLEPPHITACMRPTISALIHSSS